MNAHCRCPAAERRASRRPPPGRRDAGPSLASVVVTAFATSSGVASLFLGALGPLAPPALGGPLSSGACLVLMSCGAVAIGLGTPER